MTHTIPSYDGDAAAGAPHLQRRRPVESPTLNTPRSSQALGLTDLREQDSCGIGFIADLGGQKRHKVLEMALQALSRLAHRGALGADGKTSDGTGVLTQIPWKLLRRRLPHLTATDEDMALGMLFLPKDEPVGLCKGLVTKILADADLAVLSWGPVPVDPEVLGADARETLPRIVQVVIERPADVESGDAFERRLYIARRRIERAAREQDVDLTVVSLSHRTVVYKSMALAQDLPVFYPDLADLDFVTAIALFHQRFSTNTHPTWRLAQPFRMLAHNGEINTIQGNLNWMRAREPQLESDTWGERLPELLPVLDERASDSAMLDQMLELLFLSGRDPLHAAMMLMPEAMETGRGDTSLHEFYEYHAALLEPWDGPAALVISDGRTAAAALDRNGLRPQRFWRTKDGLVILGSEVGIVDVPEGSVVEKGRLGPGEMLAVDTVGGRLLRNAEIKGRIARQKPYGQWLNEQRIAPPEMSYEVCGPELGADVLARAQKAFGYSKEALDRILVPMASTGKPPVGSMGNDAPPAVLSQKPVLLYSYFKQRFAQVTNPPIDPLRERLVFDLKSYAGGWSNLLGEGPEAAHVVTFSFPVLTTPQFDWLCQLDDPSFQTETLDATFDIQTEREGLRPAVDALALAAERAVDAGKSLIVLSDRQVDAGRAPIPMLLATAAVHHHLVRVQKRMKVSIICDTAEPREDHHYACLLGFGATLIHPYLALATVQERCKELDVDPAEGRRNYWRALEQGLLKSLSRLGVCPMTSYHGAQLFEIVGLDEDVVAKYFVGTRSRIGGVGLRTLAEDVLTLHGEAYGVDALPQLADRGFFRFRKGGEHHELRPQVFKFLHKAVRTGSADAFRQYSDAVDGGAATRLRDLLTWNRDPETALPLGDVEPIEAVMRRFCTAAMSLGALSKETHEALAVGMNQIGGRSNSGEGGEDTRRFKVYDDRVELDLTDWQSPWKPEAGDSGNSAIKQVASGRFGVAPEYLMSAKEIEIKMAQGSKPGEGGQIPGHKVTADIARLRNAVEGVPLISPPPHHDIYSIEDLAQLIHDLKRLNPEARIGVKLVSLAGVGTVACGVAKAGADYILISGDDGGTGASPLSSIKHVGLPWELGLAEAQQMLVQQNLRGRVGLRVDGGLKTGRDIVIAALLGAEEFAFGTAPLIAVGCVMARQCHLNTCPVGIATQREDLRGKFPGKPEHVVAFMSFVAEEVRHGLASMGLSSLDEAVGRLDLLDPVEDKAPVRGLNLDRLLVDPDPSGTKPRRLAQERNGRAVARLDERVRRAGAAAMHQGVTAVHSAPITGTFHITNQDRSVGARLSGYLAQHRLDGRFPDAGDRPLRFDFYGVAGQSFGVFLHRGLDFRLIGEAQDYVGKGLAGGRLVLRPQQDGDFSAKDVIAGNTLLYGATAGELFASGSVGERFCVRNSGATAVVEGCGDHGCEYMTSGVAVILGPTGRNFGAGMSGGEAFVLDLDGRLEARLNVGMVTVRGLDPASDKALELHRLVSRHAELTGSHKAKALLQNWSMVVDSFRHVVPTTGDAAQGPVLDVSDEAPGDLAAIS